MASDAKQTCEVMMEREGASVWVLVEGIATQDGQGPERLCRAAVIDISPQKGADEFVAKPSSGMKFGEVVEGLQHKWVGRLRVS